MRLNYCNEGSMEIIIFGVVITIFIITVRVFLKNDRTHNKVCERKDITIEFQERKTNKYPKMQRVYSNKIYRCSNTIVNNVKNNPNEYVYKYFYKDKSSFEQQEIKNFILYSVNSKRPLYFVFIYTSPNGRTTRRTSVLASQKVLDYICQKEEWLASAKGQRALMTPKLREEIKERDNYTCKKCGNSTRNEPNLLLEVDHIIPVSKGGKTVKENLQTLCWKCNRAKSDKM